MINKVIAYSNRDNLVILIFPAPKGQKTTETYKEYIKRTLDEIVPDAYKSSAIIVQETDLPGYGQFDTAYKIKDGAVVIDMPAAKEAHLIHILSVRDEKLPIVTNEEISAFLDGDEVKRAAAHAKKLALRDLENTIDMTGINTPKELSEYWPEILKDED